MQSKTPDLVSVAGSNGPYSNIINALKELDISFIKGKSVLLKPNAGRFVPGSRGITTHPKAVEAVIDAVMLQSPSYVAIGESPILGVNTIRAFESTGIKEIADNKNIPLIDMDKREPVQIQIEKGRILDSFGLCADVQDFDIIVSVPVAKTHMHTEVTLGIKNMKGCLWRNEKVKFHQLEYKDGQTYPEKTLPSWIVPNQLN